MGRHRSDGGDGDYGGAGGDYGGGAFLSYSDLEKHYGKSRVTLWRWVRAGLLPAPYEIGPNSAGFRSQEIRERDAKLKRKTYGQEV